MTRLFPALIAIGAALLIAQGAAAADKPKPAAPSPAAAKKPRAAEDDAATYERCLKLAKEDPAAARDLAETWHDRGGAHPADHCFAAALIGLGQPAEGAKRLEKLAQEMIRAPASLRADVLGQGAQAWLLAGDPGRAYAADSAALTLRPDNPELLLDRAEAAGSAGWFDKAVVDLDRVLQRQPGRVDALVYRASAYRGLDKLDPALADVEAALRHSPDSAAALLERGNIRRLKGDLAGARADWLRIALVAPGGAEEAAALANIQRLEFKEEPPPAAPPRR